MEKRESFSSRLGFLLISAGCAIGLGNVWRFPYITGKYGGGAFVLVYLLFLVILGLPVLVMELSVGRGSQRSIARSFHVLEPEGTKWHWYCWFGIAGNYLLMMFYTVIAGWLLLYCLKMAKGDFEGLDAAGVAAQFNGLMEQPGLMTVFMLLVVLIGMGVCFQGLQNGVERITKVMMVCLLAIMAVLAVRSLTLEGGSKGLRFYLQPNFHNLMYDADGNWILGESIFAAMGQAFFTLSLGIGAIAVFGSYIGKEYSLAGEALRIGVLDTAVAFTAGLIIFPACSAFEVSPGEGPPLIFVTLPNIFNGMAFGRIWGAFSRPCILGFNIWSGFQPLGPGSNISDLEDFIISNNLLPLGSLLYVLFCVSRKGWGWENFLSEANQGQGLKFPGAVRFYVTYLLPIIVLAVFILGYWDKFSG